MTTVVEPKGSAAAPKEKGLPPPQLYLQSEVLDFNVFPSTDKTGENIKAWFVDRLAADGIDHSMVAGVTPDGAATETSEILE
jgi:hypothetical protein